MEADAISALVNLGLKRPEATSRHHPRRQTPGPRRQPQRPHPRRVEGDGAVMGGGWSAGALPPCPRRGDSVSRTPPIRGRVGRGAQRAPLARRCPLCPSPHTAP
jgi:hypothetical protein